MKVRQITRRLFVAALLLGLLVLPVSAQHQQDDVLDYLQAITASIKPLPKRINFKVARPQISGDRSYRIELARWGIASNGTNPVATTLNLQQAIDWAHEEGFNRVVFPAGHYLVGREGNAIYQAGLQLKSDTTYHLEPGVKIEMAGNNKWNYCVLAITRQSNIVVQGGELKGDRASHVFTPRSSDGATAHDEGHGICVQSGSTRILVQDMRIHSLTGDGLLLVTEIEDVSIQRNKIFNNRRQGVSIVGGTRIAIERNEIHHIRGTSPQFGVDIEGAGRKDKDILIRSNYFHHNRGGDVVNTSGENVFIVKNTMDQGTPGFDNRYIDGPIVTWHRTDNVIAQNKITMYDRSVNGFLGYIQYSGGGPKSHNRMTYVHDNICNGCGMYMYKSADADIRRNIWQGYFLALADFTNATVIDNQTSTSPVPSSPRYCWSYRIARTTGVASGNTHNDVPVDLPLSARPWTTQCLRR